MKPDVVETVMLELLEEQKICNIKMDELLNQQAEIINCVKAFELRLNKFKTPDQTINRLIIEELLFSHQQKVQQEVSEMKKFMLAGERKKSFKQIIYKCLTWLLIFLLLYIIFKLLISRYS